MTRLALARSRIGEDVLALLEFQARMGGYIDSALTLLEAASADALENLRANPDDEGTKRAVLALATAMTALDPLVAKLCPRTTAKKPDAPNGIGGTSPAGGTS